MQCVVEPGSTGIGDDCFAPYSRGGTDDVIACDGSGWAPAAASVERLRAMGVETLRAIRRTPSRCRAPWTHGPSLHRDHGRLPLRDVLAPAIRFAEEGYAVAPRAGSTHRQPRLANTLRTIAETGRDAFYRGAIAADLVAQLQAHGGLHTLEDFAEFRGEYVTPIRAKFRGYDVIECPPAGQGVIALLLLRLLDKYDAEGSPLDPDRLHREIEAAKLAYAVRDAVPGDPRHGSVDVDRLLSDAYVDNLRSRIDLEGVLDPAAALTEVEHRDTVYITVVDRDRNCVSFINSLFYPFGSGLMGKESGVMLHNRGMSFSVEPGRPNTIALHKRPLHTIIPGMVARDGRVQMSFGVMGGHYQAMGHAHFLSKVLHYGLDMQAAMDLPRVFPRPGTGTVEVESTLPANARAALADRGFKLVPAAGPIGGSQAIRIDWERGVLTGASDHRKDGCALGY